MDNTSPARNSRAYIHITISAVITGVMLYFVFSEEGSSDFWEIVSRVNFAGVGLYIAMSLVGVFIRARRYQVLLRTMVGASGTPSYAKLMLVTFARNALVDMLPARLGEGGYLYFLNRAGVPVRTGATTFAFCVLLDALVLFFIISCLALLQIFVPFSGLETVATDTSSKLTAFALALALLGVMYFLIKHLPQLVSFAAGLFRSALSRAPLGAGRLRSAADWVSRNLDIASDELRKVGSTGALLQLALLTFWLRVLKYGSLYVLLLAVVEQFNLTSANIPPLPALVAFLVAEASASLPISGLMGIGAYESSLTMVLSLSKVSIPSTFNVSFIVHLITQLKAYTFGAAAIILLVILSPPKRDQ